MVSCHVIGGDFNHRDITDAFDGPVQLEQIVIAPTRGDNALDFSQLPERPVTTGVCLRPLTSRRIEDTTGW